MEMSVVKEEVFILTGVYAMRGHRGSTRVHQEAVSVGTGGHG